MTIKLTAAGRPSYRVLFYCPDTGKQVVGTNWRWCIVPGGQAIWWRCSACRGWHVVVKNEEKEGEIYGPSRINGHVLPCDAD